MFALIFLIFTGVMRFATRLSRVKTLGSVWESGIPAALIRLVIFTFRSRNRLRNVGAAPSSILLTAAVLTICTEYVIIYKWTSARRSSAALPGYAGTRDGEFWSGGASASVRRRKTGGSGDDSKSILDARGADWWAWDGIDSFLLAGAGGAASLLLLATLFYPNPPQLFLGILEFVVVMLDVAPASARALTSLDAPMIENGSREKKAAGGAWREFTAVSATVGDALSRGLGAYYFGGPASFVGAAAATFMLELAAANMASILDSLNALANVIYDTVSDVGNGRTQPPTAYKST